MSGGVPTRDELASRYLDQLSYELYPVQEEALLTWFTAEQGVLVCAPTGTGKTLIAEAALFEALHTGRVAYYTTPLIALTEQKFQEMQEAAVRWGFAADDVGLVTGNRRVNPQARVLVVVAEILLNRLLHPTAFDFTDVSAVVMDEFHNFADRERGVVWELSLGLLPEHVRLLLLSATVGNAAEFIGWLARCHQRKVQLVQSTERKVPLAYEWVPDQLLNEQLQLMSQGDDETRRTPALIFCFNRNECWNVAEQLKGKHLLGRDAQKRLVEELKAYDWTEGVGPKLKQVLLRGVGVHHAGLLPKNRRIVEDLFQRKLLSVTVCTETLSAGMNLPARSVVLTALLKGPPLKKKLLDASTAHQIFGRAGRPQFDDHGYIYALAHEDDVKLLRWREKYDTIPQDTKDPNLRRAKKAMKRKMPSRRKTQQYWSEAQFQKLQTTLPGKLSSRGPLPWRLLAYLLKISPDVIRLRSFVRKRLMEPKRLDAGEKALTRMLLTLWAGDFVTLEPEPPARAEADESPASEMPAGGNDREQPPSGTLGALLQQAQAESRADLEKAAGPPPMKQASSQLEPVPYQPALAHPTLELDQLLVFRGVNPLYGVFLIQQLGIADHDERIQALESVLDMPGSVARQLRVPPLEELPPGPLATNRLDAKLIGRGLVTADELQPGSEDDFGRERRWVPALGDKLRMLFDSEFPNVGELRTRSVWAAGDLLRFNGNFNKFVKGRDLTKQEGIVFRHLLRLILLCDEFVQLCPPETTAEEWQAFLRNLSGQLTAGCRAVDPDSTDKAIETAHAAPDVVEGELSVKS